MDTKKLRQKILDLAIRGKLVPQDPNDEPASVLLERIRAEKERLIKEGKIKRSKKTASDTPNDKNFLFPLPEKWCLSTLGEFFYMHAGKSISASEISSKKDNSYRYKCVGGNGLRGYVQQYNTEGEFPIIGRQGALCGNINLVDGQFYATEHAVIVDTFCETNVKWAYFFLIQLNLNQYATATAQPGLSVNNIGDVQIPIPPQEEQYRIVDAIEHWYKLIDLLECEKEKLGFAVNHAKSKILDLAIHGKLVPQDPNDEPAIELLKCIREDKNQLVKEGKLKKKDLEVKPISEDENPFEIPESWEWVRLKSIASKIVDGDHNPPSGLSSDSGYYMLSSKNIDNDNIVISDDARFLSFEDWRKCNDRTNLRKGDILLTTVATLGRSCVYEDNVPYCFQRSVSIIHTFIINYFLKYCFDSPYYQSLIDDKATGTAQRGFYLNQLEESIIPVPPLAEQLRIVAKIKELFTVLDEIKESLN